MSDEPRNADQYSIRLPDGRTFGPAGLEMIVQWAREGRVPRDAMLVPVGGGEARSVLEDPKVSVILNAPPTVSTGLRLPPDTAGPVLIPYKNPAALIGYYFAVFSLIPFFGALLGIVAVILGVVGLVQRSRRPQIRGLAHAWVAIILGALTTIGYSVLLIALIASA